MARLRTYLADPAAHADWQIVAGERCGDAPFILPTTGYLGFGYGDAWRPGHSAARSASSRHQGFDLFGPTGLGETAVPPVPAAIGNALGSLGIHITELPMTPETVLAAIDRRDARPSS